MLETTSWNLVIWSLTIMLFHSGQIGKGLSMHNSIAKLNEMPHG